MIRALDRVAVKKVHALPPPGSGGRHGQRLEEGASSPYSAYQQQREKSTSFDRPSRFRDCTVYATVPEKEPL